MPLATFAKRPVHVLGAGGIGVALAWSLVRAGCAVTVVENNPAKLDAGRTGGLVVSDREPAFPSWLGFHEWTPPVDATVFLCTKTYDNSAVLSRLRHHSQLIPVQNGFDPELDQHGHFCEGVASFVSECLRDRPVTRITRPGSLHLGARCSISEHDRSEIASIAAALISGGLFKVEMVENVLPYKAAKLMYNAAISPLAAAAGVDNGELLTAPLAKRLFFAFLQENYAILRHAGVPLARIGPFHPDTVSRILRTPALPSLMAIFFRPSLRGTFCSMAPDISTGRTEIEAYNGHLIRLAGSFPCPLNRAAFTLVNKMMRERLTASRANLNIFESALNSGGAR